MSSFREEAHKSNAETRSSFTRSERCSIGFARSSRPSQRQTQMRRQPAGMGAAPDQHRNESRSDVLSFQRPASQSVLERLRHRAERQRRQEAQRPDQCCAISSTNSPAVLTTRRQRKRICRPSRTSPGLYPGRRSGRAVIRPDKESGRGRSARVRTRARDTGRRDGPWRGPPREARCNATNA